MGFLSNNGADFDIDYFKNPSVMKSAHAHTRYELYFCPEDVVQESVINGVGYSYEYPCAILSTPYTIHSMSCGEGVKSYERFVFYFGEKTLNAFDEFHLPKEIFGRNTGLLFPLSAEAAAELRKIAVLCSRGSPLAEKELMFAMFVNRLVKLCPPEQVVKVGTPSFYIQDVLQYVAENYKKNLNADEIAKLFAVSRSKLDRDFKRFTGGTIRMYIEMCRLNQAKYLLNYNMEMSVGEIAALCGFENESYFFPFFKKAVGMTPAEYRRKTK